jgi:hypothetical protein
MSDATVGVIGTLSGAIVGGVIGWAASWFTLKQEHKRIDAGSRKQLLSILRNVGTWFLISTKLDNPRPVGEDDWQVSTLFRVLYSPEVAQMLTTRGDGVADAVYNAARKIEQSNGSIAFQRNKLTPTVSPENAEIYAGMKRAAQDAFEAINMARLALGDDTEIRYPFEER